MPKKKTKSALEPLKTFILQRNDDETGISGTGIVARGVVLESGQVVMEWRTFHSSITIFKNIEDVAAIHGHNGKTVVIFD